MKTIKIIASILFALVSQLSFSQSNADTLRFKVKGNCDMCKENIEEAVNVKGVKSADWNMETGIITVVRDPQKISEEKIHELIAGAGYETNKRAAVQSAYDDLPGCCQYTQDKKEKK
jgi:copper chaperone CopZ